MKLMRHKVLFFILSGLVILPGLFFIITSGLKPGIDFTGGAELELHFQENINPDSLKHYGIVIPNGSNTYTIRTKPINDKDLSVMKSDIKNNVGNYEELSVENIGPVIGSELKTKALLAVLAACVMIILYITYSFRKVPKPASSFRFGITAIVALIHDVLVVVGLFAIFGKFLGIDIDILFVTALLTIIGFSVHDTIVVFDRIRENLPKHLSMKFTDVADISITQTLGRSLNTSLTVLFVLLALLLFGGETIRWFVAALLIGIISGTYSSIFNATALLCWWEERLGH